MKSQTIYDKFTEWCVENGLEYNVDALKLSVRMSRLKINGIEKTHNKSSRGTKFNIELMKKHFGIGCLL